MSNKGKSSRIESVMWYIVSGLAVAWALFHLYTGSTYQFPPMIQRSVTLGFALCLALLTYKRRSATLRALDVLLALIIVVATVYVVINWLDMSERGSYVLPAEMILGTALTIILLEVARRRVGWIFAAIGVAAILYARFGASLPGILGHPGFSWERVIGLLYNSTEGIFGIPMGVMSYVFLFILFGEVFQRVGAGAVLSNIALIIFRRSAGGPAKAAVIGSGLFGMVSGSGSANVLVTGTVTIPLMKKVGFTPEEAGAVEAAASSGGAITPPVMAATAFLMMEILGVSYLTVITIAFLPAVLYYLGMFFGTDRIVKRHGIGRSTEELPFSMKQLLVGNWYLFMPFVVLIALIIADYPLVKSILWSCVLMLVVFFIGEMVRGRDNIPGALLKFVKDTYIIIRNSALSAVTIGSVLGASGIILGAFAMTGLANKFAFTALMWSHEQILPLLIVAWVASLILGTAIPATAAYIIVSMTIAPSLELLGLPRYVAHYFAFYSAVFAMITPPVAVGAFVAASIAHSSPMKTAVAACRIGLGAFAVPFMFAYTPSLLILNSTAPEIIMSFAFAVALIYCLDSVLFKCASSVLNWAEWLLFLAASVLLFIPDVRLKIAGLGCGAAGYLLCWWRTRGATRSANVSQ